MVLTTSDGSGRTTAFRCNRSWRTPPRGSPAALCEALNFHMKPHPVVVLRAAAAPEGWHPRFSAIGRKYRYRILNRRPRPALLAGRVWHVQAPLDAGAM